MIGLGVDLVDIERFRRVLARRPTLVNRLFSEAEVAYANQQQDPTQRLAVRFAAKEATLKALGLGLGGIPLADIEVVRDGQSGRPSLQLHKRGAMVATEHGVSGWLLSLSHTDLVAQATVIAI